MSIISSMTWTIFTMSKISTMPWTIFTMSTICTISTMTWTIITMSIISTMIWTIFTMSIISTMTLTIFPVSIISTISTISTISAISSISMTQTTLFRSRSRVLLFFLHFDLIPFHWLRRCRYCWLLLRNLIRKLVSYELLKRSNISVSFVLHTIIFLSTALEKFKCWVSCDILGRAERGGHRAVHLGNGDLVVRILVVLGCQLLPDRSKSLTLTTPWIKEHHKVRRATN